LIQIDASNFAEFEISEFEISRFDCTPIIFQLTQQELQGRNLARNENLRNMKMPRRKRKRRRKRTKRKTEYCHPTVNQCFTSLK